MRRRLATLAVSVLLAYWTVLFIATHWPDTSQGKPVPYVDKIAHVCAYAILAWLAAMVLRIGHWPVVPVCLTAFAVCITYGALDEWLQHYTARTASVWDWTADVVGTTLGLAFFLKTHNSIRQAYLRRFEKEGTV